MSNDIGVAVIGAGMAGRAHAHGYRSAGTVFSAGLPPVRLVSVADINEDLARDTARRYGFERADTSWQAVVKADDIDVVSVVVANHLHREIVDGARRRGQARPVREAAGPDLGRRPRDDRRGRGRRDRGPRRIHLPPGAGDQRGPPADRVGRLGRPLYISAQYWTDYGGDPQAPMSWRYRGGPGSGALADLGSHLTDVAEFLLGPVDVGDRGGPDAPSSPTVRCRWGTSSGTPTSRSATSASRSRTTTGPASRCASRTARPVTSACPASPTATRTR